MRKPKKTEYSAVWVSRNDKYITYGQTGSATHKRETSWLFTPHGTNKTWIVPESLLYFGPPDLDYP